MYKLLAGCLLASCLCLPATASEPGRDSIFGDATWYYETGGFDKALQMWEMLELADAIDDYEKGLDDYEEWLKKLEDYLYGGVPIS